MTNVVRVLFLIACSLCRSLRPAGIRGGGGRSRRDGDDRRTGGRPALFVDRDRRRRDGGVYCSDALDYSIKKSTGPAFS